MKKEVRIQKKEVRIRVQPPEPVEGKGKLQLKFESLTREIQQIETNQANFLNNDYDYDDDPIVIESHILCYASRSQ